jgi:transcriptional regulator with XRE-family HTH domain
MYTEREKLKKERKRKGLSQEKAARAVNMSRSFYRNIEAGVSDPSLSHLIRLCNFYGKSVEELFFN